jgi:hypothetical protein
MLYFGIGCAHVDLFSENWRTSSDVDSEKQGGNIWVCISLIIVLTEGTG